MSSKFKMPTIQVFMTKKDEDNFSRLLKDSINGIEFIDIYNWNTNSPQVRESLSLCYEKVFSAAAILNTNITSLDDYKDNYVFRNQSDNGYTGSFVGKGLIQFLHSKDGECVEGCLKDGRLSASYNPTEDPETDAFVKAVWKIFKKGAKKVYAINRETGELYRDKPETRYFAWPDAAKIYDGTDGRYLTATAFNFYIAK
ncbi:hypothetical protein [Providencia manganoxydans]|uniref:hypothetical protein n=1 Tax=Providencia manganoxydans TaxID=2923283 RepID=UPI0032DABEC7